MTIPLINPRRLERVRHEVDAEVALLSAMFTIRLCVARQCMAGNLGYAIGADRHPGSGCFIITAVSLDELEDCGYRLEEDGVMPRSALDDVHQFRTVVRAAAARLDDAETAVLCLLLDRGTDVFFRANDIEGIESVDAAVSVPHRDRRRRLLAWLLRR